MRLPNKIALVGGTGKSGIYLTRYLIDKGIRFRMLARNPEKIPPGCQEPDILYGDVSDYDTVHNLIQGCDAVISTLGLGFPPSEPTIFSKATSHIIKAMKFHGISRYIVISGLNVDAPNDEKGAGVMAATHWMYSNYPASTRDRQTEYELLVDSNLDWTLVRLPVIVQTTENRPVLTSLKDCPGDQIGAADLAIFLTDQLTSEINLCQAPFLANSGLAI